MGEFAAAGEAGSQEAEQDEQGMLATALDAINSLISASFSASLFPLKWQLVRDRFNRLHAGLADITVIAASDGEERHEAFDGLLRDVVGAVREARELVPRPCAGASREDLRFYVRDLFARLRVGGAEMRREAAAALNEVLRDDDKCVRVVVSDVADGIGLLIGLLESADACVQEEALDAISVIAGYDASCKGDLVGGGVIAPVIRVLNTGAGTAAKERAARVLSKLTENADNAWAVAAHGGVTALVNICSDHRASGGELVCAACRVLMSIVGVEEIRKYMVADAGAVPVLVSLLQGPKDEEAQIQAMELLAAIASGDSSSREVVLQEGTAESLVRALDPGIPRSSKAREVALRAIDALCFSSPDSIDRLIGAVFLNRVLFFLRNGDTTLQHCALKAAHRLCHVSEETKKAMGDAGFMPELVGIVQAAKSLETREMAAEALCAMMSVHCNRKRFVQDDRNVAQVLQLLGPDEEKPSPAKRFLLSTLVHLADSNSGRRKIMSSEHVR
ncbi:unnamed protein product [Triticum turgidum subsp. durum]|uniref:DUF7032 domain-containing protein n=1 Tax=Triticum turgidum subsp. durum TaxID=4567 RepID=A0A9R1NQ11_TRITD|nr:unnamed protein product [Triticum turgidum subsp. durum]